MERKHRTQMTQEEIAFTETLVHAITEWDLATQHAQDRMQEKGIKKQDVVNTLKYGVVIEVGTNGRALLRLMKGTMKGTCAVVSIRERAVITVWRNIGADNHKTLTTSEYTWKGNVIEFLRTQCR